MPAGERTHDDLPEVSVLLTYYNEEAFLQRTLDALKDQVGARLHVVLVNNASSDDSAAIAERFASSGAVYRVTLVNEPEPGRVRALQTAARSIDTPWAAICDADTLYPPDYFKTAIDLMKQRRADAAFAYNAAPDDSAITRAWRGFARGWLTPLLLRRQCHAGGYGQTYRSAALQNAGSYSAQRWPYVLEDHEIAHRVLAAGKIVYASGLYCYPNLERRADPDAVRWTLLERLLYHVTPYALKDWFFYSFLAQRFERRGQTSLTLREQSWN